MYTMFRFSIAMVLIGLAAPLWAAEDSLPRYQLPVGRRLTYSSSSHETRNGAGTSSNGGRMTLTVVRENADGSRRIVLSFPPKDKRDADTSSAEDDDPAGP